MSEAEGYDEPYPVAAPSGLGHTSEGALQFHINSSQIIEEIEHSLKSEEFCIDPKTGRGGWKRRRGIKPIINDKGINSVITILKSRLSKIFIFSDLEENNIREMTKYVGESIIDDLYYNWQEYEIKDTAAASVVVGLVTDTVYATLRKGYGKNYLKFLSTTQSIQEIQHNTGQQRMQSAPDDKQGILNTIFKRRR